MDSLIARKREEKKDRERYYAVLEDFVIIEGIDIQDIKIIPNVRWLFQSILIEYFETQSYGTPYSCVEYKCIDHSCFKKTFNYKDIKGYRFKEELKSRKGFPGYDKYVQCQLSDVEGKICKVSIVGFNFEEFFTNLIVICDKLIRCKTWEIYHVLEENANLSKENQSLKATNEMLTNQILKLKNPSH